MVVPLVAGRRHEAHPVGAGSEPELVAAGRVRLPAPHEVATRDGLALVGKDLCAGDRGAVVHQMAADEIRVGKVGVDTGRVGAVDDGERPRGDGALMVVDLYRERLRRRVEDDRGAEAIRDRGAVVPGQIRGRRREHRATSGVVDADGHVLDARALVADLSRDRALGTGRELDKGAPVEGVERYPRGRAEEAELAVRERGYIARLHLETGEREGALDRGRSVLDHDRDLRVGLRDRRGERASARRERDLDRSGTARARRHLELEAGGDRDEDRALGITSGQITWRNLRERGTRQRSPARRDTAPCGSRGDRDTAGRGRHVQRRLRRQPGRSPAGPTSQDGRDERTDDERRLKRTTNAPTRRCHLFSPLTRPQRTVRDGQ